MDGYAAMQMEAEDVIVAADIGTTGCKVYAHQPSTAVAADTMHIRTSSTSALNQQSTLNR